MQEYLAITDKGIEKVTITELERLIKAKGSIQGSCVRFGCDEEEAFRFCYFTQSSDRVLKLLGSFEFSDFEDLLKKSENLMQCTSLKGFFEQGSSFRMQCERRGLHDFASPNAEQEIGGFVIDKVKAELGFEPMVELKHADSIFYVFIENNLASIGIDLVGRDLSKRQYRIFTSPGIINAKLAFAAVILSGYNKNMKLIDLYSGAGLIPIETAILDSRTSINFYNKDFAFKRIPYLKDRDWDSFFKKIDSERLDSTLDILGLDPLLRNVEAGKKNAKLAGIDKLIGFSKMDLEWVDTKLEEGKIDLVISRIPSITGRFSESMARKNYKELFYQAEFFLKQKGRLCILSENLLIFREMITKDFRIVEEHHMCAGQLEYEYIILEKE